MNKIKEYILITAKHYSVYLLCYIGIIKYYTSNPLK